jgi:hypothetical protein
MSNQMPLNVPVRIHLRSDGNFIGGKPFEDVVTSEDCIMGDVYYSFRKRKEMLWGDAIDKVEVLNKAGKVTRTIE